jgi:hypothetical protein
LGTILAKNLPKKDFTKKTGQTHFGQNITNLFWTKTGQTYFGEKNRINLFLAKTHRVILTKLTNIFWTKTGQTYFGQKQNKLAFYKNRTNLF